VGRVDTALMWHVVLTVAGDPVPEAELRCALERLAHERPFLLTARYASDRAEIRYWDEAERLEDAAALALRLWGEHRQSAGLPGWRVVGLEVLDRETFRQRGADAGGVLVEAGSVRPF
jgi:hypothetical protein